MIRPPIIVILCLGVVMPFLRTAYSQPTPNLPLDPSVQAMVGAISADTLFENLETLVGFYTRHTNSDTTSETVGIGAARRWIYRQFQRYSNDPATMELLPSYFTFTETVCGITGEHRNVLATLPGEMTPERNFLVTGHIDSRNEDNCDAVGYAPGANDDGSGTAVAIELARVASKYRMESTLILMPVTGEEQGLLGSTAYAEYAVQQGIRIDGVLTSDIVSNIEGCVDPSCPVGEPMIIDSLSVRHFSGTPDDGNSRQLARYLKLQGLRYNAGFTINLIPALDRPGRGGDHIPFYDRGFASVRFTEAHETGDGSGANGRQHNMFDTISVTNTNAGYMANVARLSIAGFASLALAPETPQDLEAFDQGDGESVMLLWSASNTEPDFAGYMIAARNPDSLYYQIFFDAGNAASYSASGLTPDEPVYFSIAAYDSAGNLSTFSDEISFTPTVVPRMVENAEATSSASNVLVSWDPSIELDVVKYRLYRSVSRGSGFVLHDSVAVPTTQYSDIFLTAHVQYYYKISAVDADGNEGMFSGTISGQLVTHDLGILIVDGTRDGTGTVLSPTDAMVDDYYLALLSSFTIGGHYDVADSIAADWEMSDADLAEYSTVVRHTDVRGSPPIHSDTTALRKYLENGGRLFLGGWKLSLSWMAGATTGKNVYSQGSFTREFLKVDSTFTSGALTQDFETAMSASSGFADVEVDSAKIPLYGGTLVNTDAVLPPFADPSVEVLFTHHGIIPGSVLQGKPVAWKHVGSSSSLIVFDFPLYYMESGPAGAALRQALMDLGEPTDVGEADEGALPSEFALYQNFPNPFNPSTTIRFDMPEEGVATVVIYDLLGQRIRVLLDDRKGAGSYSVLWNGRDEGGVEVSSGVYYVGIKIASSPHDAKTYRAFRAMVLLK